ncbi:MAG TPA: DnaT-like ssDNA-binding protein [Planctomycetota bacterium]|nr:DnaT-like ssDNA-binding protein [Planctomycetota bacterium]
MAFVLETGAGLANSNGYLTHTEADAYFVDHGAPADWTGTQAQKESAIQLSTQYVDAVYHHAWKGDKRLSTQALDWPRVDVEDENGWPIASDIVPQRLKDAVAELALRVLQGDTLVPDIENPATLGREAVQVGPISIDQTFLGGQSQVKRYRLVDLLLADLITDSDALIRA